jgi:catechol 2,3-dioxygenase-like lactoylglutathione lyase family enzyme
MQQEVERLVSLYDGGGITRRQLLEGLAAIGIGGRVAPGASGPAPGSGQAAPVFQARSINHVTLYVSDVARSKAFYQSLTGLPVRAEDKTFCELRLQNSFLGLYSPDPAERPGIDHFCFGIEHYDPRAALAKLKAAVPSAQPTLENEDQVYVRDPDGVRVQFADVKYKR